MVKKNMYRIKKNMYRRFFVLLTALSSALSFGMNPNLETNNGLGFDGSFLPPVNQGWERDAVECLENGDAYSAPYIGRLPIPVVPNLLGEGPEYEAAPELEDEIANVRVNARKRGTKRGRGEPAEAEANEEPKQKQQKRKECTECPKSFKRSGDLTVHMRTHTGERPYTCKECNKGFNRSGHLTDHMRVHTGEKQHKCPQCEQAFVQKSNLTEHIRIHTGEKPFECKDCGVAFSSSSTLRQHVRTHQ